MVTRPMADYLDRRSHAPIWPTCPRLYLLVGTMPPHRADRACLWRETKCIFRMNRCILVMGAEGAMALTCRHARSLHTHVLCLSAAQTVVSGLVRYEISNA